MNTTKNTIHIIWIAVMTIFGTACDKKNDNLIRPNVDENFPQIILLADEGDGELEDEDSFSFVLTLAERQDPEGKELGGTIVPLTTDVTVHFEIEEWKGFDRLEDYILEAKAFYEIDDCNTSEDLDIDLNLVFDPATGKGSVTFPAGVEEVEIEFETDDSFFDDYILNTEERMLTIRLTGVDAGNTHVVANTHRIFEYVVLDDEAIYGEYEVAIDDPEQFAYYLALFGILHEEVASLSANDVEEILVEFKYGEFSTVIVLKETMEVNECGEIELVNREIEIEGDLEEIDDSSLDGEVEIVGDIELANGAEEEFVLKGKFKLDKDTLLLTLTNEFDGEETEEVTLRLKK